MTAPGVLEHTEVPTRRPARVKCCCASARSAPATRPAHPRRAGRVFPIPMTLGHEIAGTVDTVGAGVEAGRPATGPPSTASSAAAGACLRGEENRCRVTPVGGIGLSRDGGLAVVVPASRLLPVGDMDLTQAAPLTDAGLTLPTRWTWRGPGCDRAQPAW
ncbi:alcohol dehydrogenase catalytic domain-containing protein [Micromonospora sp. BRA006-A]|nr:alcohol dehydrogenase catalytic domain-containing protein [Micromonospora sp. BRA006-A]